MAPPARPQAAKQDIDSVLASLIERGIVDDQNFSILRQHSDVKWEVTFDGAQHVAIGMGEIDYADLHKELSGRRAYSAKLIDGALLQMMYRFEGEVLVKHRLAYYPSATLRPFEQGAEEYLRDELYADIVSRRIVPFPVRFDFDRQAAIDIDHPQSHLTLGDVLGCRIPVTSGVTPRWFVEFVLRNFYQTGRHNFVDQLPPHRLHFDLTITNGEKGLMHLVVPAPAAD